eukprot:563727-Pyramimonas_sp.AAC.1
MNERTLLGGNPASHRAGVLNAWGRCHTIFTRDACHHTETLRGVIEPYLTNRRKSCGTNLTARHY